MKLIIKENPLIEEPIITIETQPSDQRINRLVQMIESEQTDFIGKKDDQVFKLSVHDIYYIESFEEQCTIYTKQDVYDCRYRLYEVEAMHPFLVRVNKQMVLNYQKILKFKSTYNGKLEATLINKDRIEISRRYVKEIKDRLGGEKHEKI